MCYDMIGASKAYFLKNKSNILMENWSKILLEVLLSIESKN